MNPVGLSGFPRMPSRRNRRAKNRDGRLLDGTMKYQGEFMPVDVLNLSESGAYLIAPILPQFADSVTITIDLPFANGAIMVAGRVRRVSLGSRSLDRPTGFGVEFTQFFTRAGRETLQAHVGLI